MARTGTLYVLTAPGAAAGVRLEYSAKTRHRAGSLFRPPGESRSFRIAAAFSCSGGLEACQRLEALLEHVAVQGDDGTFPMTPTAAAVFVEHFLVLYEARAIPVNRGDDVALAERLYEAAAAETPPVIDEELEDAEEEPGGLTGWLPWVLVSLLVGSVIGFAAYGGEFVMPSLPAIEMPRWASLVQPDRSPEQQPARRTPQQDTGPEAFPEDPPPALADLAEFTGSMNEHEEDQTEELLFELSDGAFEDLEAALAAADLDLSPDASPDASSDDDAENGEPTSDEIAEGIDTPPLPPEPAAEHVDEMGDVAETAEGLESARSESQPPAPAPLEPTVFADAALETAVRDQLGLAWDTGLTDEHLASVVTLDASGRGIHDLTGIEALTRLQNLTLNDNAIADISPLAAMPLLQNVSLDGNAVTDASPLSGAQFLRGLSLRRNQLTDVQFAQELPRLTRLELDGNAVTNLQFTKALPRLLMVSAADNAIADMTPLLEVPGLISADLRRNTIAALPVSQLAALESSPSLDLRGNPLVGGAMQELRETAPNVAEQLHTD